MEAYDELRRRCFDHANGLSPEEQIEAYGAVISANRSADDVERAYFMRGLYRVDFQGDFEGAIGDYTRAIALTPDPRYFDCRAGALCRSGQGDAALADWARVLELDPASSSAHLSIGVIHLGRGDVRRALKCFDDALEISPSSTGYYSRSLAHRDLGHQQEAMHDLEKAIELSPNDPIYRGIRAAVALKEDRPAAALRDLNHTLDYMPGHAMTLYMRGAARRSLGDGAGAEADFAEARRLSPDIDREMAELGLTS